MTDVEDVVRPMQEWRDYCERVFTEQESLQDYFSGALQRRGLQPVAPGVWFWPGTSNALAFETGDGVVLLDSSAEQVSDAFVTAVASLGSPVSHVVLSHGHVDHIGGCAALDRWSDAQGHQRPEVVAHANLPRRFARYQRSLGYNDLINQRQFLRPDLAWPRDYRLPDRVIEGSDQIIAGDLEFHLSYAPGETDDQVMTWVPAHRLVYVGDLFNWCVPNSGNPQKVLRDPRAWAESLRRAAALRPLILTSGHGVPVYGQERVQQVLDDTASVLERIDEFVLERMNRGETLGAILEAARRAELVPAKPYLRPAYDEPEFIVHAAWHTYGGWYDGNPARLKPMTDAAIAEELVALAGDVSVLIDRARAHLDAGAVDRAVFLSEYAVTAAPDSVPALQIRTAAMREAAGAATSTMAFGIYAWSAAQSLAAAEGIDFATALARCTQGETPRSQTF